MGMCKQRQACGPHIGKCQRAESHSGEHDFKYDGAADLSFAEAMALDPSEVEVRWAIPSDAWYRLSDIDERVTSLKQLRGAHFRRSRPRLSRVEEMAADNVGVHADGTPKSKAYLLGLTDGIGAVCEWLRKSAGGSWTGPQFAGDIEREFLEPR